MSIDQVFHDRAIQQRDLAWREVDTLRERVEELEKLYEAANAAWLKAKVEVDEVSKEQDRIKRIAATGTIKSFMALSDGEKREWFATTLVADKAKTDLLREAEAEVGELNNILRQAGWGQGEIDSCWETVERVRAGTIEECAKLVEAMGEGLELVNAPISAEAAGGFAAAIRALKEKP